ncbi:hypothetical protein TNCV_486231 [Trichonephila clavipes]|nr:hypothetical protein TNCV_486231 [Trichonephila clavipes]
MHEQKHDIEELETLDPVQSEDRMAVGNLQKSPGLIIGYNYRSLLADHLHSILQAMFSGERAAFQDDNAPVHTSRCVQISLHEHNVEHLTLCFQSSDPEHP